jgi:hypothetical protein
MKNRFLFILLCIVGNTLVSVAQIDHTAPTLFTRADTLRGSIGSGRDWWDVTEYVVLVEPDYNNKSIKGKTDIGFKVLNPGKVMQIDLQEPMKLTKAYLGDVKLNFKREGNVFFIEIPKQLTTGSTHKLALAFEGNVTVAKRPPWDGGWIFTKDKMGRPWMTAACQGLGAWSDIKNISSRYIGCCW